MIRTIGFDGDTMSKEEKLTAAEKCVHYIRFHTAAYGAPADQEDMHDVFGPKAGLDHDAVDDLLSRLERDGVIKMWKGKFTAGWVAVVDVDE